MQVPGVNYSRRVTQYLKDPSKLFNENKDLIFTYPFYIDKSLLKYDSLLREFYSINLLTEIFVSNYLFISTSVADDAGSTDDTNEYKSVISNLLGQTQQQSNTQSIFSQSSKQELVSKLLSNQDKLYKIIHNHPKYKKLQPEIEIITLDNKVDIPVIVGTESRQLSSEFNLLLLLVAFADNRTLSDRTGVKRIVSIIQNTPTDQLAMLISYLFISQNKSVKDQLAIVIDTIGSSVKKLARFISKQFPRHLVSILRLNIRKTKILLNPVLTAFSDFFTDTTADPMLKELSNRDLGLVREDAADLISALTDIKQTDLKISARQFESAFDTDKIKEKFNISSAYKSTATVSNISENLNNKLLQLQLVYSKYIEDYIRPFCESYSNLLSDPTGVSIIPFLDTVHTDFMNSVQTFVTDDLVIRINKILDSSSERVETLLTQLDVICGYDNTIPESIRENLSINTGASDQSVVNQQKILLLLLKSKEFGAIFDIIQNINLNAELIQSECDVGILKYRRTIGKIFGDVESDIFKSVDDLVSGFYKSLERQIDASYVTQSNKQLNSVLFSALSNSSQTTDTSHDFYEFTGNVEGMLKSLMTYLFYNSLILFLCSINDATKISVEVGKNNRLAESNYITVIPLATVLFVHSTMHAKSFKSLINKASSDVDSVVDLMKNVSNVNQNNHKFIIKQMSISLNIPNLIVVDTDRDEVYYKFAFSGDVTKQKLSTMSTYITDLKRKELTADDYPNYKRYI